MNLKGPYTPRKRCLTLALLTLARIAVWGGIIAGAVVLSLKGI
jgi:hypothetical protein